MKTSQADVRKQLAEKTRKIVDQQKPLTLPQFLAQGQQRSRQQRKPMDKEMVQSK
ncbi:MAG: hypothetical protein NTW21_25630 [Verrucomicrobia bacterium]|nr:hypothetical protein [Verrucomicrobiota bacterium]